jgi:spore maturation protein CgeB
MRKILCVGPQWRGSNAAALFKAFSRLGYMVDVVDENYYINLSNKMMLTKVIDKLFFYQHCLEFNKAIVHAAELVKPDMVLVYKGAFVLPAYLQQLKKIAPVVNVYPDVSFRTHGKYLPQTLPLYDWIFTTKTFGLADMKDQLHISNASFIPHGFDPEIHHPGVLDEKWRKEFECDVSFIGTHSLRKEKYLSAIQAAIPGLRLKIWGNGWSRSSAQNLTSAIQYKEVLGDVYALAIQSSKINLGILSEKVGGASSGDLITSRTFHIPASGGFLLHQRTEESVLYYKEGIECAFFEGEEELIEKVTYYLSHEAERVEVLERGRQRALSEHSIDRRVQTIIQQLKTISLLT